MTMDPGASRPASPGSWAPTLTGPIPTRHSLCPPIGSAAAAGRLSGPEPTAPRTAPIALALEHLPGKLENLAVRVRMRAAVSTSPVRGTTRCRYDGREP